MVRRVLAAVTGFVLVFLLTTASATTAAPAGQDYYWRWSDGSFATSRTFAQGRWGIAARLPRLVVSSIPATSGEHVRLQSRRTADDGSVHWVTENTAVTAADGTATLAIDPYCAERVWCRARFAYRLVAGGQTAGLQIGFTWSE